jgi:hypothetical protein
VNGDGKVDLIGGTGNTLVVLTNNGYGIFVSNAVYTVGTNPISISVADINGDGKLDLICANYGTIPVNGTTLTVLTLLGGFDPCFN